MDIDLKKKFINSWRTYFGKEDLPITFFFTDERVQEREIVSKNWSCVLAKMNRVRKGRSISLSKMSIGCDAGLGYLGFNKIPSSHYDYLSIGEEKYKPNPEMVKAYADQLSIIPSSKKYLTFKRWDMLEGNDLPEVVIFFATPDVLSGLFYLVQFNETEINSILAPFSIGCTSILTHPLSENRKAHPRSILGLFDLSCRVMFNENLFTLAIPMKKMVEIINYMDKTFLNTKYWQKLRKRIDRIPLHNQ
ncbi:MAG: DUF169 domain-containing protein [Candidatus Hodarchaeales archaeon]|jgi:hypothetical protein